MKFSPVQSLQASWLCEIDVLVLQMLTMVSLSKISGEYNLMAELNWKPDYPLNSMLLKCKPSDLCSWLLLKSHLFYSSYIQATATAQISLISQYVSESG